MASVEHPSRPAVLDDEADEELADRSEHVIEHGAFSRHRVWWLLGALLVLGGISYAVWFGLQRRDAVQVVNTGFEVVSDDAVEVQFDVHRAPGKELTCVIRAQDIRHATVGRREVVVPASEERGSRVRFDLRTTTRAVTGFADSCVYR